MWLLPTCDLAQRRGRGVLSTELLAGTGWWCRLTLALLLAAAVCVGATFQPQDAGSVSRLPGDLLGERAIFGCLLPREERTGPTSPLQPSSALRAPGSTAHGISNNLATLVMWPSIPASSSIPFFGDPHGATGLFGASVCLSQHCSPVSAWLGAGVSWFQPKGVGWRWSSPSLQAVTPAPCLSQCDIPPPTWG